MHKILQNTKEYKMKSATKELSRGYLLRETNRLSTDILSQNERVNAAGIRLEKETAERSSLLERIATAEAEHTAAERQRQYESANDSELVGLQRAVASTTLKRQELIKQTKTARSERDRAREECLSAYYLRLGAEFENSLVNGSSQAIKVAQGVQWTPEMLKVLTDSEGVWRRVSNQGIVTRDLIEGSLALANLQLKPEKQVYNNSLNSQQQLDAALDDTISDSIDTQGNTNNFFSAAPSSSGTANIFVYTGAQTALTETKKSLVLIQEVLDICDGLQERLGTIQSTSIEREGEEGGDVTIVAVERLVQLVSQNATMQRTLLLAIEASLEASVESSVVTTQTTSSTSGGSER